VSVYYTCVYAHTYICTWEKNKPSKQVSQISSPSLPLVSYLPRVLHALITNLIINTALVRIGEGLIRLCHFGETLRSGFFLGFWVLVRVVFHGQLYGGGGGEGGRGGSGEKEDEQRGWWWMANDSGIVKIQTLPDAGRVKQ